MKTIALKVEVATLHGTQHGVPRLLELFQSRGANATFLFSVGPDHTGRALGAIRSLAQSRRQAGLPLRAQYGLASLLRGTLLPAAKIGERCREILLGVEKAGFETGILAWDSALWLKKAAVADSVWTEAELERAMGCFSEIFGHAPATFGAPVWQMNRAAFRRVAYSGIAYASATRGQCPFWPIVEGEPVPCVQLPTTLPLLEELASEAGGADAAVEALLVPGAPEKTFGEVFTLRAEVEGGDWLPFMERLLDGWLAHGHQLISLGQLYENLAGHVLPWHCVESAGGSRREAAFSSQGLPFPA